MSFTPINTQEEFDLAITDRLNRERAKYADYDALKGQVGDLTNQIAALTQERDNLNTQIKAHETNSAKMRIAHETGIPFEMASRLSGETEQDIRADAEAMAKFINKPVIEPVRSTEPAGVGDNRAALRQMLHNMKGE